MKKGSILGVDLNEKSCQISYYDENKEEPETMESASRQLSDPLILGYYKDRWVYGQESKTVKRSRRRRHCHTSVPEGREKKKSTCRRKDT